MELFVCCEAVFWELLQALGIDFEVLSASDVNTDAIAMCLLNHRHTFQHFFSSIEDQLNNQPCLLCREEMSSCDPAAGATEVDLMVTGSPCNPFSLQSSKRFASGAVKEHALFQVTMKSVLDLYLKIEPVVGLLEQVTGFMKPLEKDSAETPKQRQEHGACGGPGRACGGAWYGLEGRGKQGCQNAMTKRKN